MWANTSHDIQERELEKVNTFYLQKEAEVCSLTRTSCKILTGL